MVSKKGFMMIFIAVYFISTVSYISILFIFSGYVLNILEFVRIIPQGLFLSLILTLVCIPCTYYRKISNDGWIIEDSTSRRNLN
jgi:hypothetical protein